MRGSPLPVLAQQPPLVECTECGRCCTYVGVGINAPRSAREASDVLWYLYHEGVYVYVDGDREWSVHFESRCRNLGDDLRCRIYAERPHLCRGFDNRSCEVNAPSARSLTLRTPAEFLGWLRENKPRLYGRIAERFVPPPLRNDPALENRRPLQPAAQAAAGTARDRRRRAQ